MVTVPVLRGSSDPISSDPCCVCVLSLAQLGRPGAGRTVLLEKQLQISPKLDVVPLAKVLRSEA